MTVRHHHFKLLRGKKFSFYYRLDIKKQEGCGVMAHESLTDGVTPSKTKEFLKSSCFLDLYGRKI